MDGSEGTIHQIPVINSAFKLRNFFGWGSSHNEYKYEGWFGDILVHRTALDAAQVETNHLVTGPAMLSGGKLPIDIRVLADDETKPRSGFTVGPGWFSSTSIALRTTKLDPHSSTKPSWFPSQAGFDENNVPDSWMILGPFSNGRSCTLGGGRAILTNAPDGATLSTTAPKPLEIDPVSGKTWNLYKYNFVQNMVSECDRCNDNRGIDLDCHWGGANNGDRMGYAMTYVFADQARTTDLRFGGNSYKLWINGDVIIDKSDVCARRKYVLSPGRHYKTCVVSERTQYCCYSDWTSWC